MSLADLEDLREAMIVHWVWVMKQNPAFDTVHIKEVILDLTMRIHLRQTGRDNEGAIYNVEVSYDAASLFTKR